MVCGQLMQLILSEREKKSYISSHIWWVVVEWSCRYFCMSVYLYLEHLHILMVIVARISMLLQKHICSDQESYCFMLNTLLLSESFV